MEREGNFPMHVASLKAMHLYFSAAGCANYARAVSSGAQLSHKEESKGRVKSAKKDQEGIRKKVKECMHLPFGPRFTPRRASQHIKWPSF